MFGAGDAVNSYRAGINLLEEMDAFASLATAPYLVGWSAVIFRRRRMKNGKQVTETGRDCIGVAVLMGQGLSSLDATMRVGIFEQAFDRWRRQYGGMGVDRVKELKRLQY